MLKYINTLTFFFIALISLQGQQMGDLFETDHFPYHIGVDSIVTTQYMINEYSDDAPDFSFDVEGKEIDLHYIDRTLLKYTDIHTSLTTTIHRVNGLSEIRNLKFSETGKPIYLRVEKPNSEMFNEEKVYEYNENDRLKMQIRTGYDVMEYEKGNKDITTDTTLVLIYGENNLIESAQFSMGIGMAMQVKSVSVGDTLRYFGEMKMTGFMAEMMEERMDEGKKSRKRRKKTLMDVIYNKDTDNFEAFEKKRGGVISKQIIDKAGRTVEKIVTLKEEVISHEKYTYKDLELLSIEVVKGPESEIEYNNAGQKISEQTYKGLIKYEYDDKGNLIKEIFFNPYNLEFESLTLHTIYYRK
jgi:hypothetical protein